MLLLDKIYLSSTFFFLLLLLLFVPLLRIPLQILSELPGAAECDRAGAAGLELSHRWRSGLVDGTDAGAGAAEVEAEVRRVLNMLGRLKLATANTDTSCHNANADRVSLNLSLPRFPLPPSLPPLVCLSCFTRHDETQSVETAKNS